MCSSRPTAVSIRDEREGDRKAVRVLNAAAFDTPAEANLVDALRRKATPVVSLVADDQGVVIGHILFSPVTLDGHQGLQLMGLAPMAVAADRRNRGIGTALVDAGLQRCEALGTAAVIVLGHPDYYPRFGFVPAARFGLASPDPVPEHAFMIRELQPGGLGRVSGTLRYHPAFNEL